MGIKDLFTLLKDFSGVSEDVPLSYFMGKTMAVDISCVIYAYTYSASESVLNSQNKLPPYNYHELNIFPKFIELFEDFLDLLKSHNITPLFVFDGDKRPEKKEKIEQNKEQFRKTILKIKTLEDELRDCTILDIDMKKVNELRKKYAQVMRLTQRNREELKEYLNGKGYSYYTAEYDAEELCCALCREGLADCVYSTDSDVLVWGSPILVRKIERKKKYIDIERRIKSCPCTIYHYEKVLTSLNLTHEQFVDLCIMLQCDFNKRMRMIGRVKCKQLIDEFGSIENLPDKYNEKIPNLKYESCRLIFEQKPSENLIIESNM